MGTTRRPSILAVRNAAKTLSNALMAESERVRERDGHSGHQLAQQLSHDASRVNGFAAQLEELRRSHG